MAGVERRLHRVKKSQPHPADAEVPDDLAGLLVQHELVQGHKVAHLHRLAGALTHDSGPVELGHRLAGRDHFGGDDLAGVERLGPLAAGAEGGERQQARRRGNRVAHGSGRPARACGAARACHGVFLRWLPSVGEGFKCCAMYSCLR